MKLNLRLLLRKYTMIFTNKNGAKHYGVAPIFGIVHIIADSARS
jgi:hypothetical protein